MDVRGYYVCTKSKIWEIECEPIADFTKITITRGQRNRCVDGSDRLSWKELVECTFMGDWASAGSTESFNDSGEIVSVCMQFVERGTNNNNRHPQSDKMLQFTFGDYGRIEGWVSVRPQVFRAYEKCTWCEIVSLHEYEITVG